MKKYGKKQRSTDAIEVQFAFGYFCGKLEGAINRFAVETGYPNPRSTIARRVLELLEADEGGTVLDDSQHLRQVRRATAQVDEKSVGPETLHVRPRHRRTLSKASRAKIAKAQRALWKARKAKTKKRKLASSVSAYWAAMTPEQRSQEMRRRRVVGLGKKAA